MEIAAVQQGDLHGSLSQGLHSVQPAEPATQDDDAMRVWHDAWTMSCPEGVVSFASSLLIVWRLGLVLASESHRFAIVTAAAP